jgi:hypothetical protein
LSLSYSIISNGFGSSNATLFLDGEVYVATEQHPNWDNIVAGLQAGDPAVADLFDLSKVAAKKFAVLSERVTVKDGRVLFDGDSVHNALAQQIVRFVEEDVDSWKPLVAFYEKLAQNPNQASVEQLYRWLETHDFTIDDDGNIIGYKGVEKDGEGGYRSCHAGHAVVDGVDHNGKIPNYIGAVVEMPRSEVTFDPGQGCSYGLHVGTYDYAQSYTYNGVMLKVLVNPRDVVSVPTDAGDAKLRTCRYTVLDIIDKPVNSVIDVTRSEVVNDPDQDDLQDGYNDWDDRDEEPDQNYYRYY